MDIKVVKVGLTVLVHLIFFTLLEILTYKWKVNNNFSSNILLMPFWLYLIFGGPTYLILTLYYLFIDRVKILRSKIIWVVFTLIFVLFSMGGLWFIFLTFPHIATDGDSGFALPFGAIALAAFLVAASSLLIIFSKKILSNIN